MNKIIFLLIKTKYILLQRFLMPRSFDAAIIKRSFHFESREIDPGIPFKDYRSEIWFSRSRTALRKSWQKPSQLLRAIDRDVFTKKF